MRLGILLLSVSISALRAELSCGGPPYFLCFLVKRSLVYRRPSPMDAGNPDVATSLDAIRPHWRADGPITRVCFHVGGGSFFGIKNSVFARGKFLGII